MFSGFFNAFLILCCLTFVSGFVLPALNQQQASKTTNERRIQRFERRLSADEKEDIKWKIIKNRLSNSRYDDALFVELTIGTPPQKFTLELDIYEMETLVHDVSFPDGATSLYNESASQTNVRIPNSDFNYTLKSGHFDNDTMNIAGLNFPSVLISVLNYSYPHYTLGDGSFGIRNSEYRNTTWKSLSPSLDKEIWTLTLDPNEDNKQIASLSLGSVDSTLCNENYVWMDAADSFFYGIPISSVVIDEQIYNVNIKEIEYISEENFYTSQLIYDTLVNITNAESKNYDTLTVDCSQKRIDKTIKFQVEQSAETKKVFEIPIRRLISEDSVHGGCILNIKTDAYSDKLWTIGNQLLYDNCLAYDVQANKIGFSTHRY